MKSSISKENLLIYINGTPTADSVFRSHIASYLQNLHDRGGVGVDYFLSLTEDADSDSGIGQANREIIRGIPGLQSEFIRQPSFSKGFGPLEASLKKALSRLCPKNRRIIFHANSYLTGYLLLRILGKGAMHRVFVDFKGILPQECLYYDSCGLPMRFIRYLVARRMEKYICRHADGIAVVSQAFKDWVVRNRGFDPERIWVVPSCVDAKIFKYDAQARRKIREALGLGDAPVAIYSGSMRKWQIPERMFALFTAMYERDRNVRFLFLTNDGHEALRHFKASRIPEENFHLLSAGGRELAEYLSAGDVGILLRKNDIVNAVASPTKFGEYLRCGLGVIATDGIGDFSGLIRRKNFGFTMASRFDRKSFNEAASWFLNNFKELRKGAEERSGWAEEELGWGKNIETLIRAYSILASSFEKKSWE